MRPLLAMSAHRILFGLLLLGLLGGCSGKKVSTGVADQTSVPGPQAQAPEPEPPPPSPPVEVAPESPPPPPMTVESPPPPVEPPPVTTETAPSPVEPAFEPPAEEAPRAAEEPRVSEPSSEVPGAEAPLPQIAEAPLAKPIEPPPQTEPASALQDVYFDFDQSALRAEARTTLEENAILLRNAGGGKFLIEGHCDERGTAAYNLILGEQRAKSVKRYLENLGISDSQLQIVSYGKERPFCTDHTDSCWQSNRRAHFVVK